jgi:biopolymer transport protein ExbB
METLFETYVLDGGPLMVVLLLCSLVLLTIVIRDLIRFQPDRVMPPKLLKEGGEWSPDSDQQQVVERLRADPSPLSRVLAGAMEKRNERALMEEPPIPLSDLVEGATELVVDDLYEDLGPLSTIYTVAPLLGLLGTILGMMSAFREYARATDRDLSVLSEGIQQALVTTLWGLAISILAYVAARYFERRIRRFEREVLPPRAVGILEKLTGLSPDRQSLVAISGAAAGARDEEMGDAEPGDAEPESGKSDSNDAEKGERDVESA